MEMKSYNTARENIRQLLLVLETYSKAYVNGDMGDGEYSAHLELIAIRLGELS